MSGKMAIVTPDGVTPRWMMDALAQRGLDTEIAGLRMETVGTGQLGETRRYHIDYKGSAPPGAPASVVGKFSSLNDVARETGLHRNTITLLNSQFN